MNKSQLEVAAVIAKDSIKAQLMEEHTWAVATGFGIYQGLKYNGSVKRGLGTGVAILGIVSGVNAVRNIVGSWSLIKKAK